MVNQNIPKVECQMMIRKPISEVFQAFIDPAITTKFWFTKSSGKLTEGKSITWEWEMYGVIAEVTVDTILENERISIRWGEPKTTVDFKFSTMGEDKTYVEIINYGFSEIEDALIEAIKNNTGGFTTVLDGAKAFLEFGIQLNLVKDKFPHIQQK